MLESVEPAGDNLAALIACAANHVDRAHKAARLLHPRNAARIRLADAQIAVHDAWTAFDADPAGIAR